VQKSAAVDLARIRSEPAANFESNLSVEFQCLLQIALALTNFSKQQIRIVVIGRQLDCMEKILLCLCEVIHVLPHNATMQIRLMKIFAECSVGAQRKRAFTCSVCVHVRAYVCAYVCACRTRTGINRLSETLHRFFEVALGAWLASRSEIEILEDRTQCL
jgi:hypothetical protein